MRTPLHNIFRLILLLAASLPLVPAPNQAMAEPARQPPAEAEPQDQTEKEPSIWDTVDWETGPTTSHLGPVAVVEIPKGFRFVGAKNTQTLLELMGNPISGEELGLIAPDDGDWFVVFEFEDVGFVKDDEKDELDAEAMLQSIVEGNEAANRERKERGWATLRILGWKQKPRYNPVTHNLEWAVDGESDSGSRVINFHTRLLGRRGVMRVDLVTDPDDLDAVLPTYASLLDKYTFKPGNSYAEYRTGDKVAKYGLAALITGGAVAVAAKSGFLKAFWKLIVVAAVGIGGFLKKLFSGRQSSQYPPG